jgi:glycosyltransferase involved in cell wall biosynthesis
LRILVISQYFWPENFRVNDFCNELKNQGCKVSVLTGIPNYPEGKFYKNYRFTNKYFEIWNEIKIYRSRILPRRNGSAIFLFLNYFSFAVFASIRVLFINEKFDKIIVYQLSPGTVGLPGFIASKKFKAPMYFYLQDLWPESLTDAGNINSKLILKFVDKMMLFFYNNSYKILVQSKGFIHYLSNKGVSQEKIFYLPNTVEEYYAPVKKNPLYNIFFPCGFNIVFAGNIGLAQDFETIIKAAKILKSKNLSINWIIIGEGRGKKDAIDLVNNFNLADIFYFLGAFPNEEMPQFFSHSDVLLVSLKESFVFSLTIPSKIQSYLACRKPILGNLNGIGANTILESKSGLISKSGDSIQLAKNAEILYNCNEVELNNYAQNGFTYFKNEFDRKIVYNKLLNILNL